MKSHMQGLAAVALASGLLSASVIASGTHVYETELTFADLLAFDGVQLDAFLGSDG